MKVMRFIMTLLLALMVFGMWLTIIHQAVQIEFRRIPEERLIELLELSQLNEHRLAAVAAQNEVLTTRTQTILERLVPAPPAFTLTHEPDQPLVLYEAQPVKPPIKTSSKKGRRP